MSFSREINLGLAQHEFELFCQPLLNARSHGGVYNLAGFITTASGQRMAFVQYLSGYAVVHAKYVI